MRMALLSLQTVIARFQRSNKPLHRTGVCARVLSGHLSRRSVSFGG